jgi:hypothetical protein
MSILDHAVIGKKEARKLLKNLKEKKKKALVVSTSNTGK